MLVPARHLAIWADLIPEDDFPGLRVGVFGTVQLRDIFVVRGVRFGVQEDDVATPRVADVAFVANAIALTLRASAKAVPDKLPVGWGLVPDCGCFDGVRAGLVTVSMGMAAMGMITMRMTAVMTSVRGRIVVRMVIVRVIVVRNDGCTREDVKRGSERTDANGVSVDVDKSARLNNRTKVDVVIVVVVVVSVSEVLAMNMASMVAMKTGKG